MTCAQATPGSTSSPSCTVARNLSEGSTSRNVICAISRPATTPGSLATITARAPMLDGTAVERGHVAGADILGQRELHQRQEGLEHAWDRLPFGTAGRRGTLRPGAARPPVRGGRRRIAWRGTGRIWGRGARSGRPAFAGRGDPTLRPWRTPGGRLGPPGAPHDPIAPATVAVLRFDPETRRPPPWTEGGRCRRPVIPYQRYTVFTRPQVVARVGTTGPCEKPLQDWTP